MERQRVVIKFGSSSLTTGKGNLDKDRIQMYVDQIADLKRRGHAPVIVSSGAVAAGYRHIGYKKRPRVLAQKQAAAAVGQALLMQVYQELFDAHDIVVSQLLLTRDDLADRVRCHNAFSTLEELLHQEVIPIINENDSVSVDELKFGDNDMLSSYVANLVKASHLLIITDTNGLYTADPRKNPQATRIHTVKEISDDILQLAGGAGTVLGTGGMRTKIEAARVAISGGIAIFIGQVTADHSLADIVAGKGDGTYFLPSSSLLPVKKQWLCFHSRVHGELTIDEGAERALIEQGKSLLPAGVREVDGHFHAGDVVEVKSLSGTTLGKGISNYNDWQIQAVKGLSSPEVKKRIRVNKLEVIQRDEWVQMI